VRILNIIYIYLLICIIVFPANSCAKEQVSSKTYAVNDSKEDSTGLNFTYARNELEDKLSNDFTIHEISYFLVASNLTNDETEKIINNTIISAVKCFYNDYFDIKPDDITTIFLFKNDTTYKAWAKKLYDDENLSRFGYYKPLDKVMLMNISTGTGTLVHEMTHALVRYDFPAIPSWFNEGLGSLYERCSLNNGEILGYVNWRLPELQDAIRDKTYTSLDKLMKTNYDEFYGTNSSFNYSQARYLCMYLQENGLLKKFYKLFRDTYSNDNSGKTQLVKIYGKKLNKLEEDYMNWVKGLKPE